MPPSGWTLRLRARLHERRPLLLARTEHGGPDLSPFETDPPTGAQPPEVVVRELGRQPQQACEIADRHPGDLRDVPEDSRLDLVEAAAILRGEGPRGIERVPGTADHAADEPLALEDGEVVRELSVREPEVPPQVRIAIARVDEDVPADHPADLVVRDTGPRRPHVEGEEGDPREERTPAVRPAVDGRAGGARDREEVQEVD